MKIARCLTRSLIFRSDQRPIFAQIQRATAARKPISMAAAVQASSRLPLSRTTVRQITNATPAAASSTSIDRQPWPPQPIFDLASRVGVPPTADRRQHHEDDSRQRDPW
ncbi:hypothetical protein ACLOJK_011737 [Asimina triloba]